MGVILANFKNCERAGLIVYHNDKMDGCSHYIWAYEVERYLASRMSIDDIIKCREAIAKMKEPESGTMDTSKKEGNFDISQTRNENGEFFKSNDFNGGMNSFECVQIANRLFNEWLEKQPVVWGDSPSPEEYSTWSVTRREGTNHSWGHTYQAQIVNVRPIASPDSWEHIGRELLHSDTYESAEQILYKLKVRAKKLMDGPAKDNP